MGECLKIYVPKDKILNLLEWDSYLLGTLITWSGMRWQSFLEDFLEDESKTFQYVVTPDTLAEYLMKSNKRLKFRELFIETIRYKIVFASEYFEDVRDELKDHVSLTTLLSLFSDLLKKLAAKGDIETELKNLISSLG